MTTGPESIQPSPEPILAVTTLVSRSTVPATAVVMAAAFADDPVLNWLFEAAVDRAAAIARFFELAVDAGRLRGHTYAISVAGGVRGGAIWMPPDVTSTFDDPQVIADFATEYVGGDVFDRLGVISELMGGHHPEEPAFYLNLVGVDPARQGEGLGVRLLGPVFERCDHDGVPAYLESSNRRNIPFYERLGFQVISNFGPTEQVSMAGMWRAPRPAS